MYCFCFLLPTTTKSGRRWHILSRIFFDFGKQPRQWQGKFYSFMKNLFTQPSPLLYFVLQKWFFLSLSFVNLIFIFLLSISWHCTVKLFIGIIVTFAHLVFTTEHILVALIRPKFNIIFVTQISSSLMPN